MLWTIQDGHVHPFALDEFQNVFAELQDFPIILTLTPPLLGQPNNDHDSSGLLFQALSPPSNGIEVSIDGVSPPADATAAIIAASQLVILRVNIEDFEAAATDLATLCKSLSCDTPPYLVVVCDGDASFMQFVTGADIEHKDALLSSFTWLPTFNAESVGSASSDILSTLLDKANVSAASLNVYADAQAAGAAIAASVTVHCLTSTASPQHIAISRSGSSVNEDEELSRDVTCRALEEYTAEITAAAQKGYDVSEFQVIDAELTSAALASFDANISAAASNKDYWKTFLVSSMQRERELATVLNFTSSESACADLLTSLYNNNIREKFFPVGTQSTSVYHTNPVLLKQDWAEVVRQYRAVARGPAVESVLAKLSEELLLSAVINAFGAISSSAEERVKSLQTLFSNVEAKLSAKIVDEHMVKMNFDAHKQSLESRVSELVAASREQQNAMSELSALQIRSEREKSQNEEARARLESRLKEHATRLTDKIKEVNLLKEEVAQLKAQKGAANASVDVNEVTSVDDLADDLSVDALRNMLLESRAKQTALQQQLVDAHAAAEAQKTQMTDLRSQYEEEFAAATAVLKSTVDEKSLLVQQQTEEIAEFASKLTMMEEQKRDLERELQDSQALCKSEKDFFAKEMAALKEQVSSLMEENRKAVEEFNTRDAAWKQSYTHLKEEFAEMDRKLKTALAEKRTAEESADRVAHQLQLSQQESTHALDDMKRIFDTTLSIQQGMTKQEKDGLLAELAVRENNIATQQGIITELQSTVSTLRASLQREETTVTSLVSKLQNLEVRVHEHETTIERLQTENANISVAREATQKELLMSMEEVSELRAELHRSKNAVTAAEKRYEDACSDSKTLVTVRQELDSARRENVSLERSCEEKEKCVAKLRTELDDATDKLGDVCRQLEHVTAQRDSLRVELDATREQTSKAAEEVMSRYEEMVKSLEGTGEQAKVRLGEITTQLEQAKAQIQAMEMQHRTEKAQLHEQFLEQKSQLNATIAQCEKMISKQDQQLSLANIKMTSSNENIQDLKRSISQLEAAISQRENMILARENTIQTRETAIQNLDTRIAQLERTRLDLSGSCQGLQLKLDDALAKLHDVTLSLNREKDARARVEDKLEETKSSYEEKFETERRTAEERVRDMEAKIAAAQADFDMAKSKLQDDTSRRMSDMMTQLQERANEVHQLRRDMASVLGEKQHLEEMYRTHKDSAAEAYREAQVGWEGRLESLEHRMRQRDEENAKLCVDVSTKAEKISELDTAVRQLNEELLIVNRMRQRAEEKVEMQLQKIEFLEESKALFSSEIQKRQGTIDMLETSNRQLEVRVDATSANVMRLENNIEDYKAKVADLKKHVAETEALLEERSHRVSALEKEVYELTLAAQQHATLMLDLENQKRKLEASVASEETARARLESTVASLEGTITDLLGSRAQSEQEREKSTAEMRQRLEQRVDELDALLDKKIRDLQEEKTRSEGLVEQLRTAEDTIVSLRKQIAELNDEKEVYEDELGALSAGFEFRGTHIADLERKLDLALSEIAFIRPDYQRKSDLVEEQMAKLAELARLKEEFPKVTSENEQRGAQVQQLLSELSAQRAEYSTTLAELKSTSAQLQKLQHEHEVLVREHDELHVTLEELSKTAAEEIGSRDHDIEKRDAEIAELRNDIAAKEHAMQVSVQSIEELSRALEELNAQNAELSQEQTQLFDAYAEARKEIKYIKAEITE